MNQIFNNSVAEPCSKLAIGDESIIWSEFDRLSTHHHLATSSNLVKIFQYLLCCTLTDDTAQLKEYTIAVSVLSRREDFDPRTDSIVRTQIGKLRTKLDLIYGETGTPNGIRLGLQRGNYRIRIERSDAAVVRSPGLGGVPSVPAILKALAEVPLLLVSTPDWSTAPEMADAGLGILIQEVVDRLAGSGEIRVFQSSLSAYPSALMRRLENESELSDEIYRLEFFPSMAASNPCLNVRLSHVSSGELLLAVQPFLNAVTRLSSYQDLLANRILAQLFFRKKIAGAESVDDSSSLQLTQLTRKGWFYMQQLSVKGAEAAYLQFQEAVRRKRFDCEINIGRVLSAVTVAFSRNYAATELKLAAQFGLLDFSIGSPELTTQREALAQIVAAAFEWRWPSDESALKIARELDSSCASVPFFAFLVLLPLELFDSAIALLERATQHCITNPVIFSILGWAQLAANRHTAAKEAFREALELEPRCLLAQEGLSRLTGKHVDGASSSGNSQVVHSNHCSFSTLQLLGVGIRNGQLRTLMVPFDPAYEFFRSSCHYEAFRSTMRPCEVTELGSLLPE